MAGLTHSEDAAGRDRGWREGTNGGTGPRSSRRDHRCRGESESEVCGASQGLPDRGPLSHSPSTAHVSPRRLRSAVPSAPGALPRKSPRLIMVGVLVTTHLPPKATGLWQGECDLETYCPMAPGLPSACLKLAPRTDSSWPPWTPGTPSCIGLPPVPTQAHQVHTSPRSWSW